MIKINKKIKINEMYNNSSFDINTIYNKKYNI